VTLIFLLKIVYPTHIYVIRGNHEFESVCSGFQHEIAQIYDKPAELFKAFISSFSVLPFGAVVDQLTICVHGGIGPALASIESIRAIVRPVTTFSTPEIRALVWSDPSTATAEFEDSPRGSGSLFGESALLAFLERSGAARLLRAHQHIPDGCMTLFDDRLVSIFSASNYCGTSGNAGAAMMLSADGEDFVKSFQALAYPRRGEVCVHRATDRKRSISASLSDSLPRSAREHLQRAPPAKRAKDGRPPLPPGAHAARPPEQPRLGIRKQRSQPTIAMRDMQWDVIQVGK
jgi:protein phosphatase